MPEVKFSFTWKDVIGFIAGAVITGAAIWWLT